MHLFSRSRPGNVLLLLVLVLFGLAFASAIFYAFHSLTIKQLQARHWANQAEVAAEGAVRIMTERLIVAAELNLGVITQATIDQLNADVGSITLPDGASLVTSGTAYTVTRVGSGEALPFDVEPLQVTSDHPRWGHDVRPIHDGLRASRVVEVEVVARARARSARASAVSAVGISKFMPYPFALYTDGDADICASTGTQLEIAGAVRIDGLLHSFCEGDRTYAGAVYAQQAISVTGSGTHMVLVDSADTRSLTSLAPASVRSDPAGALASWGGRVRLGPAHGGVMAPTAFQTAVVPGSGPCADGADACAGRSSFFPSAQVQRVTTGTGFEYDLRCGWAYEGEPCIGLGDALAYRPYPFADRDNPGVARTDPHDPALLWRGLYPDYRREARCSATFENEVTFRTFRCITNPFGFALDLSLLPPVPGGVLHVQGWTSPPSGMSPFQEVLLIRNGESLAAALTIVSEVPVVLIGSYNTLSPKPAMIDAPLITVLPTEAAAQLETAAVWDSTATTVPTVLNAHTSVRVHAVLRSAYHTQVGTDYYGGTVEQIPAVLGDFSGVTLEVLGAVEGRGSNPLAPAAYAAWHPPYGAEPTNMRVRQPAGRRILHNPSLLTESFQPPGSWLAANIPPDGAGGSRTRVRQQAAHGGFTVIRRLREAAIVADHVLPTPVALP
jgi:hypothetical protein